MARHICQFLHCNNPYSGGCRMSYFRFPNDNRRKIWKKHTGDLDLILGIRKENKRIYLCEKHFKEEDIIRRVGCSVLKKGAIPLTYSDEICDCTDNFIDEKCLRILLSSSLNVMNERPRRQSRKKSITSNQAIINCPEPKPSDSKLIEESIMIEISSSSEDFVKIFEEKKTKLT